MKYWVMSDIHLGNRRNTSTEITWKLKKFINENLKLHGVPDVIFLAGDVFDRLLINNSQEHIESMEWLMDLIMLCSSKFIALRILEGTPSHDWRQCKILDTIISKTNIKIDFRYIQEVEIEYLEKHNMYILYIPDEIDDDSKITINNVKKLLGNLNLEKVDIAIMHGQFTYQLPMHETPKSFDETDIMNLVKGFISIGHIHEFSKRGRIIAQGSFDRLTFGEEGPKGAVFIEDNKINRNYIFMENMDSKKFMTYEIEETNIIEIIDKVGYLIRDIPQFSFIRLKLLNIDDRDSLKHITSTYPTYSFTFQLSEKDFKKNKDMVNDRLSGFNITKNNILGLVDNELRIKHDDEIFITNCLNVVKRYI